MDLSFKVCNQRVKRTDCYSVVNESQGYLRLVFDFLSDDWNNLSKHVLFTNRDGVFFNKHLTNDNVMVPHRCLQNDYFKFTLYGLGDDDLRITTNEMKVFTVYSGYKHGEGEDDSLDDPTIAEDIYSKLDNTREMEVTYGDGSTETLLLVVKDESI